MTGSDDKTKPRVSLPHGRPAVVHQRSDARGSPRGRRALRAPDPSLESQDAPLHFRRAQRDSHHRPAEDASADRSRPEARARRRVARRERALRVHQAAARGHRPRTGRARGRAVHHRALARRFAHQLPDREEAGPPHEGARGGRRGRRRVRELHQERAAHAPPRAREAFEVSERHPQHGTPPRPDVRRRLQEGAHRRQRRRTSSTSRSSRSSIRTPIRISSRCRSPATTTRSARSS